MGLRLEGCLWLCVALAGLGCSGGGSGGQCTRPPAPAEGPGDAEGLFPAALGDRWVFDRTESPESQTPQGRGHYTLEVTSADPGKPLVFSQRWLDATGADEDDQVKILGSGVQQVMSSADAGTPFAPLYPMVILPFPATVGTTYSQVSCNLLDVGDLDGDGRSDLMDVESTVAIVGDETVDAPVGSFLARRVDTATTLAIHYTVGHGTLTTSGTQTVWYAPGIGPVKVHQHIERGGAVMTEATEVLLGYSVGETRAGVFRYAALDGLDGIIGFARGEGDHLVVSTVSQPLAPDRLEARRIGPDDSVGPALPVLDAVTWSYPRALAFDGANYLVIAQTCPEGDVQPCPSLGLTGQRLAPDGSRLDGAAGFPIQPAVGDVAVAGRSSGGWLVASREFYSAWIEVTPVGADGAVGTPIQIATDPQAVKFLSAPRIAAGEGTYLAAWTEAVSPTDAPPDGARRLMGGLVGEDGTLVRAPVVVSQTSSWWDELVLGDVGYGGGQYLVTWGDPRHATDPWPDQTWLELRAARVSASGDLIDGPPDSGGIVINSYPVLDRSSFQVVHDGTDFAVGWAWSRNDGAGFSVARVSPAGALVDGAPSDPGLVVEDQGGGFLAPDVSSGTVLLWGTPSYGVPYRMAHLAF
jgi:hypothetical protein